MARYLTKPELLERRRLEQLRHLAPGDSGGLDNDRLLQGIEDAEAEVTSYLAPRYGADLPTDPTDASDQLKRLVADLVPYHLAKGAVAVSEQLIAEYDRTVRLLRAIAQGTAVLALAAQPDTDNSQPVIATRRPASDAKLTLEKLEGW